jgi:exosome complex component RRP4
MVSWVGGVGGGSGLGDDALVHTHKKEAILPLSGVNLPTGAQRMRTAQDALEMRSWLKEGDLISAEIQKVAYASTMSSSAAGSGSETIMLHSRSMRYGKLENGCVVHCPPGLIPRRKAHFISLGGSSVTTDVTMNGTSDTTQQDDGFNGIQVDILLGCNGVIWIQRALPAVATGLSGVGIQDDKSIPLAETWELVKKRHAQTSLLPEERVVVARVRNAIEALALVSCNITSETIQEVVKSSASFRVSDMLKPSTILQITACTRRT